VAEAEAEAEVEVAEVEVVEADAEVEVEADAEVEVEADAEVEVEAEVADTEVEADDPETEKALLNLEQSINEVYGIKAGRVLAARNVQRLERAVGALTEMMDEVAKGTEGDEPKAATLADDAALMEMEMARALL